MQESKNCSCLGCLRHRLVSEYTDKMKTGDPIVQYIEAMNQLMEIYDNPQNNIQLIFHEYEEFNSSCQLTKVFLSYFPKLAILEHENCVKMKVEILKYKNKYFSFQTIYNVYIHHFLSALVLQEQMWDVIFKYCNPESSNYENPESITNEF